MTLIAFVPILWELSKQVDIPIWLYEGVPLLVNKVEMPGKKLLTNVITMSGDYVYINYVAGSLVWAALLVSVGGLFISWFVGIRLPGLEYNNQKVEAAFRKELVYGEDDKDNYAAPETLWELFVGIKFNYHKLFLHYGYFDLWLNLYDQCMMIIPYIVTAPSVFLIVQSSVTGQIATLLTLGFMVQVSNAFDKVHNGFALFVNNWTSITELRSIWKRLHEFEDNLDKHQVQHDE